MYLSKGRQTENNADLYLRSIIRNFANIIHTGLPKNPAVIIMTRLISSGNLGCRGGWMNSGFKYIKDNRGVDGESCYPYTARVRNLIRKTCPCNVYPPESHFYIAKLGHAGVYLFFLFLLQNIDCGYSLELPRRGGSNDYPQSMF